MLTSFEFWGYFFILGNLVALSIYCGKYIWRWFLHWKHKRNLATLRLSPHRMKAIIRERDQIIAHLEDKVLQAESHIARQDVLIYDYAKEIKTLIGRNGRMANEIRCDEDSETEVLRAKYSGRY